MEINVITQSAIKIKEDKIIYFDPYQIKDKYKDADYIFITHDHYDHYDEESIKNIMTEKTKIIIPICLLEKIKKITTNYLAVLPNNKYSIDDIYFETISSYNINKPYHPKEKNYVGYKMKIGNEYIYVLGDTDLTEEVLNTKADICFVPLGGTYTMNVEEAAKYINKIRPRLAIPIHYGSIIGSKELHKEFRKLVDSDIEVVVYIK